jgi:membrane protein
MVLGSIWRLLKSAATAWIDDSVPRLGAALSFYTVFAISPLFVIIIFLASLWLDKAAVQSALLDQLSGIIGRQGASAVAATIRTATPHSQGVVAGAIAIGTLLLTATGVFVELQSDLNTIWGVEQKSGLGVWGFIKNRLLSFAMVLGVGFLLLVSLVVSAGLQALMKLFGSSAPGGGAVWIGFNAAISFLVITVLFAMIFKVLPDVRIAWRDVWVGAGTTGLLFTGGKFLIGLYLGQSASISAYGAAGSLVLILLWVYYSAQILFFGAELTQAYANQFGAHLEPKEHARWIRPQQPTAVHSEVPGPGGERKEALLAEIKSHVQSMRDLRCQLRRYREVIDSGPSPANPPPKDKLHSSRS